jgi:hypothetical protein
MTKILRYSNFCFLFITTSITFDSTIMKAVQFLINLIIVLVVFCNKANAQSVEDFRKLYPNEKAVFTKQTVYYYFELKNKQLELSSTTENELLFLYEDANTHSAQSVYQSSFSRIENLDAVTINRGKKYKVLTFNTKTNEQQNIFFDDSKTIAFNLLNLEEGATAKIYYETKYPNPILTPDVYFTTYLPVHEKEVVYYVDKAIDFKFVEFNLKAYNITFTKTEKKGKNIYTWTAKSVLPLKDDNFKINPASRDTYWPHVVTYIANYTVDGNTIKLQSDINDLYKWSYDNLKQGLYAEKTLSPKIKGVLDSLTQQSKGNKEELLKNIYSYVQNSIYYIAIEDSLAGFIPRAPGLVLDRKYGDCKDMACLLHTMLSDAGFKSYPTWIGTRDIGYEVDKLPLVSCFNHMITAVDYNNKTYFLDPTMNCLPYDFPSFNIQGKQAFLSVNEKEHKLLRVPSIEAQRNFIRDTFTCEIDGNKLKGKTSTYKGGYSAVLARLSLARVAAKDLEEVLGDYIRRGNAKAKVTNTELFNAKNVYTDLVYKGQLEVPDYVKSNGDNIYLNMNLITYVQNAVYPSEDIVAPTENNFEYEYTNVVKLKIPEGYKVKYVPETFTADDKNWACNIDYKFDGKEITLIQKYVNKQLYWYPDYYKTWNQFEKKLSKNYKESIVLTK